MSRRRRKSRGSITTRLYFELKARGVQFSELYVRKFGEVVRVYTVSKEDTRKKDLVLTIDVRNGVNTYPVNKHDLDSRVLRDLPKMEVL